MAEIRDRADDASRLAAESARRLTDNTRGILTFGLGLQKALIEEMAQVSTEMIERMHAEVEIASELVARVASAHSIHELSEAYSDCAQHQTAALKHDSEQLMRRSQRIYERAARLMSGSLTPGSIS